ncbi:hypothetical protein HPB51_009392 [Rhipicephalus microplus]|uniref:Uncharacterized protein n=1 Tax=Rhipicephalus microplus TaxID=6941 RepID=A0A9J6F1Y3_RHIMP|nr:hypothetical protein HPB51_009392 [Rhipicephalus microplus]
MNDDTAIQLTYYAAASTSATDTAQGGCRPRQPDYWAPELWIFSGKTDEDVDAWLKHYDRWVPEITHHCQKTPFLLVGTQIDLRDDAATLEKLAKNKQKPISNEQGEKLAKELKAVKYVECSALTQALYSGYVHDGGHLDFCAE